MRFEGKDIVTTHSRVQGLETEMPGIVNLSQLAPPGGAEAEFLRNKKRAISRLALLG